MAEYLPGQAPNIRQQISDLAAEKKPPIAGDGSRGLSATITFTDHDNTLHTITVKNGLVIRWTIA